MDNFLYILLVAIAIWLQFALRRQTWNRRVIGRHAFITYHDKDNKLKGQFPLEGTVTKAVQLISTKHFIVALDKPLIHKKKTYDQILITQRNASQTFIRARLIDIKILVSNIPLDKKQFNDMREFENVINARVEFS